MENNSIWCKHGSLPAWLRFIRQTGLSAYEKLVLLKKFGNTEAIYQAQYSELEQVISGKNWAKVFAFRPSVDSDVKWLEQTGNGLVTWYCDTYPELLRQIPDAPVALYVKGNVKLLKQPQIAIVGSRKPTPAGLKIATKFAKQLTASGVLVASGMALGIDSAAHKGALQNGGQTLAVLGCGLDICYPAQNKNLAQQIMQHGVLVSEFPIGSVPAKHHFPQRNRIISGLAHGVVVVEAAEKSGSLITARLALEQNREVFAVPGSVLSPLSSGCHQLIRDGAVLLQDINEIFSELKLSLLETANEEATAKNASVDPLISHIGYDATTIDEIISSSGLTAAEVSSILLVLELGGHIAHCDDGKYVRLN